MFDRPHKGDSTLSGTVETRTPDKIQKVEEVTEQCTSIGASRLQQAIRSADGCFREKHQYDTQQRDQENGEHSVAFFPLQATQIKLSKLYCIEERMLGGSCHTQTFCGQPFGRTLCDTDRSAGNEIPNFDAEL